MMPINVVKKDGSVEQFKPEKIVNSCIKAGVSSNIAYIIALEVSKKIHQNIRTKEIRKLVIKELNNYDKEIAKAYQKYETKKPREKKKKKVLHKPKKRSKKSDLRRAKSSSSK